MKAAEIRWNDQARAKILEDSDRVLREAVIELAKTRADASSDELFAEINSRMDGRFIDYEPGPDVRKYADAITNGEVEVDDPAPAPRDQVLGEQGTDVDHQAVGSSGSASDGDDADQAVNDG